MSSQVRWSRERITFVCTSWSLLWFVLIVLLGGFGLNGSAFAGTPRYEARYDATDQGVILRHGDGPDNCDTNGMREPSIVQEDGKFYLFYDGCAAPGWLACLATSDDLKTWKKHGRMLSLGPKGYDDSGTATSPWVIKEGDIWHMYYVACAAVTPAPDYVPAGPYLTMKATAKSLLGPWTQLRDFVPFRPTPGTPTAFGAYPGHILKHNGEYMMFINGGQAIARTTDLNTPWKIDAEQQLKSPVENTSIYYEPSNGYYWMFANHIRMLPVPHTDATWVFWTKDLNKWNDRDHAVVLDGRNCSWSKTIIGMATVTKVGNRLALFYDAQFSNVHHHMGRDIGLAWLDLPLTPEKIRLHALPPSEEDDTSSLKDWIWHPTVGEQAATVYFRGSFDLPAEVKPKQARLALTADDSYTVWLNGEKIGSGSSWQTIGSYDITTDLRKGRNVIAVEVQNGGGPGGLIAGITTWLEDGRVLTAGSSGDWRCDTGKDPNWTKPEFNGVWQAAKTLGDAGAAPWQLSSPELPEFLAARSPKVPLRSLNLLNGGGFEGGMQAWTVTGGDRIAYDWSRFLRDLWMGDYYLWLNGPNGSAVQITSESAQPGATYTVTVSVGYSLDIRKNNLPWPGGRLVLVTKGVDGVKEESSIQLPSFSDAEAGTFKPVRLEWHATAASEGRQIGVRLESNGPQIAWDNVRLEKVTGVADVPAEKPKSTGLVSTDWVGTDKYGRAMADYSEAGPKRADKVVGIFYYLWHGQHTPPWGNDVTKYLRKHKGDMSGMSYCPVPNALSVDPWGYYWAEPEDGYYHSQDPWILKKHLRLFSYAGVDFLYFDCTNGWTYLETVEALCKASMELRAQGLKTPQIAFVVSTSATPAIQTLYDEFYKKGKYPDLWFKWEGKPLILGHLDKSPNEEIANFFTWRKSDAWSGVNQDHWDWINPIGYGWHKDANQVEQMSVAKGSHTTIGVGSSWIITDFNGVFPAGTGYQPPVDKFFLCADTGKGAYFESQWQNTLKKDPQVVMITQWNEWIAGCFKFEAGDQVNSTFLGKAMKPGDRYFVDEFNAEFNRDIEPMKGGYGDVFVYRMLHYIRKFKGMDAPIKSPGPMTIPIDGNFADWNGVQPTYTDFKGDTEHRDFMAYDGGMRLPPRFAGDTSRQAWDTYPYDSKHRYKNTTGRNDIIECKVAWDKKNLYMYVKTSANMTPHTDPNWMLLFIDADNRKSTGWEGYDYVLNATVKDYKTTTLKKWVDGNWMPQSVIPYALGGNKMEIEIPLKSLCIDPNMVVISFHWADNMQDIKDVSEFNSNGDSAPDRGFNFHDSN